MGTLKEVLAKLGKFGSACVIVSKAGGEIIKLFGV